MAGDPNQPTEYRARPLPDVGTAELLNTLQPEQRVVVDVKNWKQSITVIVNGALLIAASLLQLLDLVFGANLLEPIVGIFTKDPEVASRAIMFVTQVYTLLNLYLRTRTTAPITFRNDPKK